jgi:hypothetical protein
MLCRFTNRHDVIWLQGLPLPPTSPQPKFSGNESPSINNMQSADQSTIIMIGEWQMAKKSDW